MIERLRIVWLYSLLFLLGLMAATVATKASEPLVSPQWLLGNLSDENIRIIDLQPEQGYMRVHLPRAVNSQYNVWRQRKPVSGKSLPDIAYLENYLGSLGIASDNHIILTPIGINASEVAVATRIYWTLKVLGHEKVSILDGGLIAYSKLPKPAFSNRPFVPAKTVYKATPNLAMAPSANEVFREWKKGTAFVDYRSVQEFEGKDNSPRPGTIPGSKNLPYELLINPGQGGSFLDKDSVASLYQSREIATSGPEIAFCNSGHRASLAWFVASEILGNKEVRLYDGSMAEWSQYKDFPIEKTTLTIQIRHQARSWESPAWATSDANWQVRPQPL